MIVSDGSERELIIRSPFIATIADINYVPPPATAVAFDSASYTDVFRLVLNVDRVNQPVSAILFANHERLSANTRFKDLKVGDVIRTNTLLGMPHDEISVFLGTVERLPSGTDISNSTQPDLGFTMCMEYPDGKSLQTFPVAETDAPETPAGPT
jgi:hypothetical protein